MVIVIMRPITQQAGHPLNTKKPKTADTSPNKTLQTAP
ncbi:hypothetical protein GAPWKB30_2079 [Gilliamella apicola]|nr:hypothetical protein GAPWKB30_2079 [Gilliamella apicola]